MTPRDQIRTLFSLGFAHRDIARVASTSVHSVMMIARGDRENLDTFRTSQIDQLYRLVTQVLCRPTWNLGLDVPAWFETPLVDGVPYTPMDLYVDGKLWLVLEYAAHLADPYTVLNEYDSAWTKFLDSDWEPFTAADGKPAIRRKGDA